MKKILVSGAFSTGKTMLVEALCQKAQSNGLRWTTTKLTDLARECPYPLNQDQNESATAWLLTNQIFREIEASQREGLIICDRGVPDMLAHNEESRSRAERGLASYAEKFFRNWISTYDLILHSRIDPSIAPVSDGMRVAQESYREEMAHHASMMLKEHHRVVDLSHDLDSRITQCEAEIALLLLGG